MQRYKLVKAGVWKQCTDQKVCKLESEDNAQFQKLWKLESEDNALIKKLRMLESENNAKI